MFHGKIINIICDGHSFINELLLSYTNTFKESSLNGLPEVLALFDLYKYALSEFLKRFRARRSRDGSYKR
jgi:histidinol phosphatase-like PHP family hydrolase